MYCGPSERGSRTEEENLASSRSVRLIFQKFQINSIYFFGWEKRTENWALFHSARHLSQHYLASPISIHVRYIGHQCSKYLIQIKEGGEKGKLPQKDDTTRKMFVFSIKSSQQYPKYICYFLIVKNSRIGHLWCWVCNIEHQEWLLLENVSIKFPIAWYQLNSQ